MLRNERLALIYSEILEKGQVLTNDLSNRFNISEVSIRKDLEELSQKYSIDKIYGGAVLKSKQNPTEDLDSLNFSPNIDVTDINNYKSKLSVAVSACSHINDGDVIFLGSGSTCYLLASLLNTKKNLSIVTNNISALNILLSFKHNVFVIGGFVSTTDNTTYFSSIENTCDYLKSVCVNKIFTSCYGLSTSSGITVNSLVSSQMYSALPLLDQKWYLMAGESKFTRQGMFKVGLINDVEYVFSDHIPEDQKEYFEHNNINYCICNSSV